MKLGDNGEAFFVEENENTGVRLLIFKLIFILFIYSCCVTLEQHLLQSFSFFNCFISYLLQSKVPPHLCTSPIPLEIPEETEESPEGASVALSGTRRKKRRRKRNRSDNHLREAARSSSEERDTERESETGLESPLKEQPVSHLQARLETRENWLLLRELELHQRQQSKLWTHLLIQRLSLFLLLSIL